MRGVIGAALIILGLAGGYLILTGKFPPAAAATSAASGTSGGTTTTNPGGPTAGGLPVNVPGQVVSIAPHSVVGLPTMVNLSDQAASLGGYK